MDNSCTNCLSYPVCVFHITNNEADECKNYRDKNQYITIDEAVRRALSACHGITQFDALEIAEAIEGGNISESEQIINDNVVPNCATCQIYITMPDYSCCAWALENLVCGDKTVEDCTEYIPFDKDKGGMQE